jgi:hypothetical protein
MFLGVFVPTDCWTFCLQTTIKTGLAKQTMDNRVLSLLDYTKMVHDQTGPHRNKPEEWPST